MLGGGGSVLSPSNDSTAGVTTTTGRPTPFSYKIGLFCPYFQYEVLKIVVFSLQVIKFTKNKPE